MAHRRALVWISCALLVILTPRERVLALEGSEAFALHSRAPIVNIEGRKGTRLYRPDDTEDFDALVETQNKATAEHQPTGEERLDQCMASWDAQTHITKSGWRLICQRQIKDSE